MGVVENSILYDLPSFFHFEQLTHAADGDAWTHDDIIILHKLILNSYSSHHHDLMCNHVNPVKYGY